LRLGAVNAISAQFGVISGIFRTLHISIGQQVRVHEVVYDFRPRQPVDLILWPIIIEPQILHPRLATLMHELQEISDRIEQNNLSYNYELTSGRSLKLLMLAIM